MKLRLPAPAKLNWTFEVLGKRDDGYHEIRSVLQTLALHDTITLSTAKQLEVQRSGVEATKSGPVEADLAYRAALALRDEAGKPGLGALIELEKVIPVAAGLGGGSSDAAAVLRGLDRLWGLDFGPDRLRRVAATVGSDVAFFLTGGTALVSGRGEEVAPLADIPKTPVNLAVLTESAERKTAQMYAQFRPQHFTPGERTRRLVDKLNDSKGLSDEDVFNTFESVLFKSMPLVAALMDECRNDGWHAHLAGSGPTLFFLSKIDDRIGRRLRRAGCTLIETTTSNRRDSTTWEEL